MKKGVLILSLMALFLVGFVSAARDLEIATWSNYWVNDPGYYTGYVVISDWNITSGEPGSLYKRFEVYGEPNTNGAAEAYDINGDGKDEILLYGQGGYSAIYDFDGNYLGHFNVMSLNGQHGTSGLVVGDFDGDSTDDLTLLKQRMAQLEAEVADLQAQCSDLNSRMSLLEQWKTTVDSTLAYLQQQIDNIANNFCTMVNACPAPVNPCQQACSNNGYAESSCRNSCAGPWGNPATEGDTYCSPKVCCCK